MSGRGTGVGTAAGGTGIEPVMSGAGAGARASRSPILSLILAIWLRADLLPASRLAFSAATSWLSLSIDCAMAWRSRGLADIGRRAGGRSSPARR